LNDFFYSAQYKIKQINKQPISTATDILLSLFDIVVCSNYPDHASEGFKSFISVESCSQPSYLSITGVPVFGDGCTFHYVCELGYRPIANPADAINSAGTENLPTIKCNNGFWSARAICVKKVGDREMRLKCI
jgi:hypothetical protein